MQLKLFVQDASFSGLLSAFPTLEKSIESSRYRAFGFKKVKKGPKAVFFNLFWFAAPFRPLKKI